MAHIHFLKRNETKQKKKRKNNAFCTSIEMQFYRIQYRFQELNKFNRMRVSFVTILTQGPDIRFDALWTYVHVIQYRFWDSNNVFIISFLRSVAVRIEKLNVIKIGIDTIHYFTHLVSAIFWFCFILFCFNFNFFVAVSLLFSAHFYLECIAYKALIH